MSSSAPNTSGQSQTGAAREAQAQKLKERPTVIAKTQEELSDDVPEDDIELDDDGGMEMPPPEFAAHMLQGVLSNFLEHIDDEGNSINVVEALLMVKNSIDKQSKCILKLSQELENMAGAKTAGPGPNPAVSKKPTKQ